jgi:cytidylate kinase
MIIAIDGPSASGKGTLAKKLAEYYQLAYLDTGLLYRKVAFDVIEAGEDPANVEAAEKAALGLDMSNVEEGRLRTLRIAEAASIVAAEPRVRAAILQFQRNFAKNPRGAVLDGRDIGSFVCPDADIKLFVSASAKVRAKRRFLELVATGYTGSQEEVLDDIEARDARDRNRQTAPLKQVEDAYLLDTSNLDIETAFRTAVEWIDSK